MMRIKKEDAVLVLIDFQERLMPVMRNAEALEKAVCTLTRGCRVMGLPVIVTQQYTKGLGPTVSAVDMALTEPVGEREACSYTPVEKTSFSCMGEPAFIEELEKTGRRTVILAGIESHICLLQTALDLLEAGYQIFIANDCIASRKESDMVNAQKRMSQAGALETTCESVLFELVGGAKEYGFKEISKLVK